MKVHRRRSLTPEETTDEMEIVQCGVQGTEAPAVAKSVNRASMHPNHLKYKSEVPLAHRYSGGKESSIIGRTKNYAQE